MSHRNSEKVRIRLFWRMLEISDRVAEIGFSSPIKFIRLSMVVISNQIDRVAGLVAPSSYMKTKATYAFSSGSADPIQFEPGARRHIVKP